ncbi:MAG: helix-turn-helix transcriptional regulator [Anaerolineae bacterium]
MALDLWQLRRQKRMTIEELARTAGVHPALIKAYELGERAIPERDLERLASALEVDVEQIKELSDPPPRGPVRPTPQSPLDADPPRAPRYDSGSRYEGGSSRYDSGSRYEGGSSRYGSDQNRPSYNRGDSGRSGFGGERGSGYGSGEGRPSYGGGDRSSGYGSGGEGRSSSGFGGERSSGYGSGGEGRSSSGFGGERSSGYGSGGEGRSSYGGGERSSGYGSGGEGRSSYGGGERRSSYGSGEGRSSYGGDRGSSYGERSSGYGGYDRGYGDRPAPRYNNDRGDARPMQRPGGYRQERPMGDDRMGPRPERAGGMMRKPGGLKRRPQVAPARPSQLEHLKILLQQLDMSGDDLLRLAGKPLSMLNRREASHLLTTCQEMLSERKPERPKGKRQRPYLPESVDEHELVYLTQVQLDGNPMHVTLFDGSTLEGVLRGFSPYALTLRTDEDNEVTVQKLAVAFYRVHPPQITKSAHVEAEEAFEDDVDTDEDVEDVL